MDVERRNGGYLASGVRIERLDERVAAANEFHLAGKPFRFDLFLAAVLLVPLFCAGTALVMLRTKMPRRWLWALVSLIGYADCTLDWSTGEMATTFLRVQLFGASYMRYGLIGPYLLSFGLPVGAAYALWRRREYLRSQMPAADATLAT